MIGRVSRDEVGKCRFERMCRDRAPFNGYNCHLPYPCCPIEYHVDGMAQKVTNFTPEERKEIESGNVTEHVTGVCFREVICRLRCAEKGYACLSKYPCCPIETHTELLDCTPLTEEEHAEAVRIMNGYPHNE